MSMFSNVFGLPTAYSALVDEAGLMLSRGDVAAECGVKRDQVDQWVDHGQLLDVSWNGYSFLPAFQLHGACRARKPTKGMEDILSVFRSHGMDGWCAMRFLLGSHPFHGSGDRRVSMHDNLLAGYVTDTLQLAHSYFGSWGHAGKYRPDNIELSLEERTAAGLLEPVDPVDVVDRRDVAVGVLGRAQVHERWLRHRFVHVMV